MQIIFFENKLIIISFLSQTGAGILTGDFIPSSYLFVDKRGRFHRPVSKSLYYLFKVLNAVTIDTGYGQII